jgi:hypothetical protein
MIKQQQQLTAPNYNPIINLKIFDQANHLCIANNAMFTVKDSLFVSGTLSGRFEGRF